MVWFETNRSRLKTDLRTVDWARSIRFLAGVAVRGPYSTGANKGRIDVDFVHSLTLVTASSSSKQFQTSLIK